MEKAFKDFKILYTKSDLSYIEEVIKRFLLRKNDIMSFFKIEKLSKPLIIQFWDSKEKYDEFMKSKGIETVVWETGRSTNEKDTMDMRIDALSFKERIKRQNHENDKIEVMPSLIVHEFVHSCHGEISNYEYSSIWVNEALAIILSEQYEGMHLEINCTLNELINDKFVKYSNYHYIGKYLFDNYNQEYILNLAKSEDYAKKEILRIYKECIDSNQS